MLCSVVVISIIRLVNIIRLIHQPDISWVGGKNLIWWYVSNHPLSFLFKGEMY